MTIEQMKKEIEKIEQKIQEDIEKAKKVVLDQKITMSDVWNNPYIGIIEYTVYICDQSEPKEVLRAYHEIIEDTKDKKNNAAYNIFIRATTEYESEFVEIQWVAQYIDIVNKYKLDMVIKSQKRKEIGELIKPENAPGARQVDCQNIQSFLDGDLTYKGLVKSTYTNCKL